MRSRSTSVASLALGCAAALGVQMAAARQVRPLEPLTVEAALQTSRFMLHPSEASADNPEGAVSLSPDGRRWVARVVRGDVARDGAWMEVVSGEAGSLAAAARARTVARLFTTGAGHGLRSVSGPDEDLQPFSSPVRWLDNTNIAVLWSDSNLQRQLVRINVVTAEVTWLTSHPTSVTAFDVVGDTVVYNALAQRRPVPRTDEGFVIREQDDVYGLIQGGLGGPDLMALRMDSQWYVSEGGAAPRELHPTAREYDLDFRHVVRISPDRTRVVLDITPEDLPAEWDRYEAPTFRSLLADARENPFSGRGRAVRQLVLVDLRSGMTRTLWSAPSMALATRVAWSPDGREVVLAPTSLPLTDADPRGVQGRAAAVMNVETGAYELLPVSLDDREAPAVLRFVGDDTIELSDRAGGTVRHHRFERQAEGWRAIDVSSARREGGSRGRDLKFRIEEALDRPARLLAQSPNGSSRALLAPNSELPKKYALGRAERIEGTLSSGQKWVGLLFYPPSYDPSKRYPLVIQSVYSTPITNEFTLYGHQGGFGSGPTMVASYPGRILAAREILVLHLNTIAAPFNTPDEAPVRQQVFEAAVETLDRRRLIDPSRVGLAGFSRNGYYVQYALTHSSFPFAAALTADNWDPSYIQQTLTGAISLSARVIGALPFESGLQAWIEHSPGFNVHRVRAPLLMIEQSTGGVPGVIGKWELFSRLRHLRKPVELFVAPDFEHGAHNTQNPRQIAAVQQRSVDWFDFWLNGREDPSAKKATQYARWRELRALRDRPLEVAPAGQAGARQH